MDTHCPTLYWKTCFITLRAIVSGDSLPMPKSRPETAGLFREGLNGGIDELFFQPDAEQQQAELE